MENEAQQLFVSDPVFNKEGVSGFTSYTLQGSKIPEPSVVDIEISMHYVEN